MKEKNGWKVWGIIAIVFIVLLFFAYSSELRSYGHLREEYQKTLNDLNDLEDCVICEDNSVHVCMYEEDYKEIYR